MAHPIILDRLKQEWYGPTWVLDSATGIWTNTPTLGEELLTNGDMELFTGTLADNCATQVGTSTTIDTIKEATIKHGGNYSQGFNRSSGVSFVLVKQTTNQTNGFYRADVWLYGDNNAIMTKIQENGGSYTNYTGDISSNVPESWNKRIHTYLKYGVASTMFIVQRNVDGVVYFDDMSVKQISLPTLFKTRLFSSALGAVKAKLVNSPNGTQAGVCMGLDSYSAPTYGVVGYHNGKNCKLEYFLNGSWTTTINSAVAFVANALIEIEHPDTTTYRLKYNGSQILGDITINDATLNASRRHGLISTYGGNRIKEFSFVPA